ncbi:tetraacyldisaccharide 4'-kinase [Limnohabitans planktonicus]|uniref:Tetraacyldisaccharide 4'-kinase n=1 Tax=Limnohabitans planktonicus II-D5 TaxID=1293045 RepID=A0A2T7UAQ2_9BURK|nr:tetraacyldisaccharide 4'-kinase [Limnohabitans planktonicus]PVE41747.1 tetraacyldisaccharide 4'-kinase [Limnohabitans planktonicus II-D5]
MSPSAFLHQHLPQVWLQRGFVARLLLPVAWAYGALVALRSWAYGAGLFRSERVPALVIVVGNVVAGGAGKTPTTIALVQHLLSQGLRVGVISRGHGRQTRDTRPVALNSLPQDVGDEPLLIHQATGVPLWVGAARADAAKALLQAHPEVRVIVCDDGLQHLALARDLEICVMDERGVGNGWLLPAGPLREPWPRKVDVLLHTGASGVTGGFQARRQLASHARRADGRLVPLQDLKHQAVDAVAGLARPQAFFDMLRQSGLTLARTIALPDHHDYAQWPASTSDRPLLCTEKDAAKLWPHAPHALAVPLQLTAEEGFWQALDALIAQKWQAHA